MWRERERKRDVSGRRRRRGRRRRKEEASVVEAAGTTSVVVGLCRTQSSSRSCFFSSPRTAFCFPKTAMRARGRAQRAGEEQAAIGRREGVRIERRSGTSMVEKTIDASSLASAALPLYFPSLPNPHPRTTPLCLRPRPGRRLRRRRRRRRQPRRRHPSLRRPR